DAPRGRVSLTRRPAVCAHIDAPGHVDGVETIEFRVPGDTQPKHVWIAHAIQFDDACLSIRVAAAAHQALVDAAATPDAAAQAHEQRQRAKRPTASAADRAPASCLPRCPDFPRFHDQPRAERLLGGLSPLSGHRRWTVPILRLVRPKARLHRSKSCLWLKSARVAVGLGFQSIPILDDAARGATGLESYPT